MVTQARRMSAPMVLPNESSGSIFTQVLRVFVQPQAFFKALPANHQWIIAALLVLVIAGYTATTQTQSSTTTSTTNATATSQTAAFDLSTLSQTTTGGNTAQSTNAQAAQATTPSTATATTVSSDTVLTNALLAGSGILLVWGGEAIFLSLICMMRGYAPRPGKSFQIAVWASLPLALMLIARYAYYANGGTGGSLGLSVLLNQWSGYSALPTYARRVVALFMSNLTLFWLWNLLLLYLGARYALGGRRFMAILVIVLWIAASTLIPAFVSEPTTRTAPRQTTTQTTTTTPQTTTQSTSNTTTTTTQQQGNFGGDFPGGGGAPPNGFPGGGG